MLRRIGKERRLNTDISSALLPYLVLKVENEINRSVDNFCGIADEIVSCFESSTPLLLG